MPNVAAYTDLGSWWVGTQLPLEAIFTNASGSPTDPTGVWFSLWNLSDNVQVVRYPVGDAHIVHVSTGTYQVSYTFTASGLYEARFEPVDGSGNPAPGIPPALLAISIRDSRSYP